ncbi:transposase [Xanthomonas theicola]|uniref:Transposase IS204/IS1001/IS1096/IS1165 DDE domain-containing protein n=1 Tax=Xanthomonas theicola TaxID=56464 RepID=A0A2S6ZM83_9XANT|nr:transposase [Xanthomonas theicola]PPT93316.1 hypothetical protein XthCFBP4691_00090 [Xanthomonas theicola]QNH24530.1 transposase [Xanthomonas theicola]
MWRPFRTWVGKNAAKAAIVFDKFPILPRLSDALGRVRRQQYKRLQGKDRASLKGQRCTRLSHRQHLALDGRQALKSGWPPTSA